jgi:signal transduction histidine kinase
VIANLYASRILGQVLTLGKEMGRVSLATSSGEYLSRSEWARPTGEPGFPAGLAFYSDRTRGSHEAPPRPGARLSEEFAPERARAILSGTAATIVEPGLRGRIVAFAPITPRPERPSEFWVLAHTYGKTEVLSSIRSLQTLTVALGGGVLAVAFLLGLLAARHFTRPIRDLTSGAEAVARGDFDYRVRVETNDELEDLAQHFTDMATRLRARERDLREARGHAERKAQELQVLLRIGGEILALLSLPEILNLVVDKARELLGADVAILCLATPGGGLQIGAVSGAGETLRETLTLGPGDPVPACACEKVAGPDARCPAAAGAAFATQVAVPMQTGTRGAGSLCVAFVAPRAVGADEREFLSALANLATIAIEKARLHGEVRELTRLEERERIAADLHDGIIQSIYAAGLGLEECVRLAEEAPGEVRRRLDELIDALNVVIRDVRNYVVGLAPERLQDRDITQALADLARGLSLNGLLDLDLSLPPGIRDLLTPEQARELYQICREALTNVVKHARASRVALSAGRTPDGIVVTVQDDGVGFDPRARRAGQGLRNLAERAARLGGDLRLETAPGRGTRVAIVIPTEVPV